MEGSPGLVIVGIGFYLIVVNIDFLDLQIFACFGYPAFDFYRPFHCDMVVIEVKGWKMTVFESSQNSLQGVKVSIYMNK